MLEIRYSSLVEDKKILPYYVVCKWINKYVKIYCMQCSKYRPTFQNFSWNVRKFMWPTRNQLPHFKFQNEKNVVEISTNFRNFSRFWGSKYRLKLTFHSVLFFSFEFEPINLTRPYFIREEKELRFICGPNFITRKRERKRNEEAKERYELDWPPTMPLRHSSTLASLHEPWQPSASFD